MREESDNWSNNFRLPLQILLGLSLSWDEQIKKSLKIPKGGNQNPYIAEEQTTQWPKESVQKDKQRSTKHTHKTKNKVTRTPLKSLVYIVVVTTMCILFFEIHVRILTRANSVALTTYGAHYGPQLGFPYNNPTSRHYPHRRDILAPTTWRRAGSSL